MNEDHGDAIDLYANVLLGRQEGWQLTGVDPDGADLRHGGGSLRLPSTPGSSRLRPLGSYL